MLFHLINLVVTLVQNSNHLQNMPTVFEAHHIKRSVWMSPQYTHSITVTMYLPNKHHHCCRLHCECCVTQQQNTTWQFLCICPAMWFSPHNCSNLLETGYYICSCCHIFTLLSDSPTCLRHTNQVQLTCTIRRNIVFLSQASWKKFEIGTKEKHKASILAAAFHWKRSHILECSSSTTPRQKILSTFVCVMVNKTMQQSPTAQSYNDFIGGTDLYDAISLRTKQSN